MQHCSNCQKQLPADKFDIHLGYCMRNIRRCKQCNRPYDRNMEDQHNDQYHLIKQCEHCRQQFPLTEFNSHQNLCHAKPIFCQHCSLNIPPTIFLEHLSQCSARSKICEKCHKNILTKNYQTHLVDCIEMNQFQDSMSQENSFHTYSNMFTDHRIRNQQQFNSQTHTNTNSISYRRLRNQGQLRFAQANSSQQTAPTNFTNFVSVTTQPSSASDSCQFSMMNSQAPQHYSSEHYSPQHSFDFRREGLNESFDDPELQAVLMASLGDFRYSSASSLKRFPEEQMKVEKLFEKHK